MLLAMMEMLGIDPKTLDMQSTRSTTELHPLHVDISIGRYLFVQSFNDPIA